METKLISIGNSKGIRIPMAVLKQCNIKDQIELEVEKDRIVLKPLKSRAREGWDKAFKLMHKQKEDLFLLDESIDMDMEEWEWK